MSAFKIRRRYDSFCLTYDTPLGMNTIFLERILIEFPWWLSVAALLEFSQTSTGY